MKKRYSSAKPYGEWLAQELVSLDAIVRSVPERGEPGVPPLAARGRAGGQGAGTLRSSSSAGGRAAPGASGAHGALR